jgi:hypothetical protein
MTRNEARALEDLNPIDGLDLPLRPLNLGDGSSRHERPRRRSRCQRVPDPGRVRERSGSKSPTRRTGPPLGEERRDPRPQPVAHQCRRHITLLQPHDLTSSPRPESRRVDATLPRGSMSMRRRWVEAYSGAASGEVGTLWGDGEEESPAHPRRRAAQDVCAMAVGGVAQRTPASEASSEVRSRSRTRPLLECTLPCRWVIPCS